MAVTLYNLIQSFTKAKILLKSEMYLKSSQRFKMKFLVKGVNASRDVFRRDILVLSTGPQAKTEPNLKIFYLTLMNFYVKLLQPTPCLPYFQVAIMPDIHLGGKKTKQQ